MRSVMTMGTSIGLRRATSLLAMAAAALASPARAAATLEVAPVRHELTAARPLLSMTVTNRGTEPVHLQVRGFAWSQDGGEDRLLTADDAIVSPPLFVLAVGATQMVRAQLKPQASNRETTYRLMIDELPSTASVAAVRVALRLSIPVFVTPTARTPGPARLDWRLDAGGAALEASNAGAHHERIREIALVAIDGRLVQPLASGSPYLLAGAQRRWSLPARAFAPGEAVRLRFTTDHGPVEVPLVAAAP